MTAECRGAGAPGVADGGVGAEGGGEPDAGGAEGSGRRRASARAPHAHRPGGTGGQLLRFHRSTFGLHVGRADYKDKKF